MAGTTVIPAAAVTFDLWQTLIFEQDGYQYSKLRRKHRTEHTVRELRRLGEQVEFDVVEQSFNDLSGEITGGHDTGLDRQYEQWVSLLVERLAPGLEQRVGSAEIAYIGRLIDGTFLEAPPRLLEGVVDVLRLLADRGLAIGLISNTGLTSPEMYREWFGQLGIEGSFDFLAFSNEQETAKPDRAIFETTCRELGVAFERTLHVGDNLHTDVFGAAEVGISTVWVRGGSNAPVTNGVQPDFTVDSVLELPEVVDRWLAALSG